jgi:hypothetical protein
VDQRSVGRESVEVADSRAKDLIAENAEFAESK